MLQTSAVIFGLIMIFTLVSGLVVLWRRGRDDLDAWGLFISRVLIAEAALPMDNPGLSPRWIRSSRIRTDRSRHLAQSAAISRTSRPGQVTGHVGAGGLVHGLLGRGAADTAVLVVLIQRGGVTLAQPE
jgi:hypothetical protein